MLRVVVYVETLLWIQVIITTVKWPYLAFSYKLFCLRNGKFSVFLLSYGNMRKFERKRNSVGHEPRVSVSTEFLSSPKLSQAFL